MPHSDRAKALRYDCWNCCPFNWCWQQYQSVFIEFLQHSHFPHDTSVGWILLTLSVVLVNASNSLSESYILFGCHSASFPRKWVVVCPSIAPSKNVSLNSFLVENGPTVFMMVTILIPFGSAFFQMSPEFMPSSAGFLCPSLRPTSYANFPRGIHLWADCSSGGLASIITGKLEDMVSIIFLAVVGYSLWHQRRAKG